MIEKEKRKLADRRWGPRRHCWLVEDWRAAYKWFSVQATALLGAITVVYEFVPAMQSYIPAPWFRGLMLAGIAAAIIGRLKSQPRKK